MQIYAEEINVHGESVKVNAIRLAGRTVIMPDKFIRIARIKDEEWQDDLEDPEAMVKALKDSGVKADIFTFVQSLPETRPKYSYYTEWDNVAAIPIRTFDYWLKEQAHPSVRKKLKKAHKSGVEVKCVEFNEDFVRGILNIYNETPVRQGRPFWHYGKNFETLKAIHATYFERACFIGAYYNHELIGFIKMISGERFTGTMQVISMIRHRDKAPTNTLIAKAVEICANNKSPFLVYGNFSFGKRGDNSLADFKQHNGFQKILLPRYYIPLTVKGEIALKLNLHKSPIEVLPGELIQVLLNLRNWWYARKLLDENRYGV